MAQLELFDGAKDRPTLRELWAERLNPTLAPADVPRLSAALARLYEHMKSGEWFNGPDLIPVAGLRYSGRLYELARAGIPFEKEHVAEGVWRYRLIHSPTNGVGGNFEPGGYTQC